MMKQPTRRPGLFLCACLLSGLTLPAAAAITSSYDDALDFASDPIGQPRATQDFDGFTDGECLDASPGEGCGPFPGLDGVTFTSSNSDGGEYERLEATFSSFAVSSPNVLSGGTDDGEDQRVTVHFDPTVLAAGFYLTDPASFSDIRIDVEFVDESSETYCRYSGGDSQLFFGLTSDTAIDRITVSYDFCGEDEDRGPERVRPAALADPDGLQGLAEDLILGAAAFDCAETFGIDDLTFTVEEEELPPLLCRRILDAGSTSSSVEGRAEADEEVLEGGIDSVQLISGANVTLVVDPGFSPGDATADFTVFHANDAQPGSGLVRANAGETSCELRVTFAAIPTGPLVDETLCEGGGFVFEASNDFVFAAGSSGCSQEVCDPVEDEFPPGYACDDGPLVTIDSPIAGETRMVCKVDGAFNPDLRMLFSNFVDGTFTPFVDVTERVDEIVNLVPDPSRATGGGTWSPVRIVCATQVDPGCPLDPNPDADGDGFPLCDGAEQLDCNDQLGFIFPGAEEICNGLDDDCDGEVDEGFHADADRFPDCSDNCPLVPNDDQADADWDGIGDACDENLFTVRSTQFVPAGPTQLFAQRVYTVPLGGGAIAQFLPTLVSAAMRIDALDLVDADTLLFSVEGWGYGLSNGMAVPLVSNRVYRFDLTTGTISTDAGWLPAAAKVRTLDALDRLADGRYVFSTSSYEVVMQPGGTLYLRPWNLYVFDPGTGLISLYLDLGSLGLSALDGVDVLPDGRVAFSTRGGFLQPITGLLQARDGDIHIFDPERGTLVLAFDGASRGLLTLNALTLGASLGEYPLTAPD